MLYNQIPEWSLDVVGDGPNLCDAKQYVCDNGLQNVFFHGFQNPVPFYMQSRIFCMTSSSEGFGVVLVEAMHFGVVPLAFDSYPVVRDIIDNEINGLLITPYDISEYAARIKSLTENDANMLFLSKNAIAKSKAYQIDVISKKWFSLFNEIMNN